MAATDRPAGRGALAAAIVLHLAVFAALTLSPSPQVIPTAKADAGQAGADAQAHAEAHAQADTQARPAASGSRQTAPSIEIDRPDLPRSRRAAAHSREIDPPRPGATELC
jgi:hypothetical protein